MSDQPTQPGHPPGWGPPPGQPSAQPPGWGASPSPPAPPPQPQWVAPPPPAPPRNWDQPQPPRPPRPRQRGAWLILAGAAAGLVVAGVFFATTGSDEPTGRAAATTVAINQPTSPPATEPPTPAYDTPTPRDFKLTVKVLEKQNFGSAGSNITYRIEAGWSKTFDPAKTYELTYEVRGGEDGPAINTMTVTGDEYQRENEEYVSTGSVGQKLTVRATDVDEVP